MMTGREAKQGQTEESDVFVYEGSELEIFAAARNWRRYWTSKVRPGLGAEVLEVGAGLGSATVELRNPMQRWTALEPDPALASQIPVDDAELRVVIGTLKVANLGSFDSVIYIDVLEHIEDDAREVQDAWEHVRPGGTLWILAPAHQWLFSPFDSNIGHFRRYSRRTLQNLRPEGAITVRCRYYDSVGLLASVTNRLLLRSASPTKKQISFWDSALVPLSRFLDTLLLGTIGKTLIVAWKKREDLDASLPLRRTFSTQQADTL